MIKIIDNKWHDEENITKLPLGCVFVFGSNLQGIHGRGSAKTALDFFDAEYGKGVGFTSARSYAIPTKVTPYKSLALVSIESYVKEFLAEAAKYKHTKFIVTRVGCNLAGYTDEDIAPMFKGCTANVILPLKWREHLDE